MDDWVNLAKRQNTDGGGQAYEIYPGFFNWVPTLSGSSKSRRPRAGLGLLGRGNKGVCAQLPEGFCITPYGLYMVAVLQILFTNNMVDDKKQREITEKLN